MNEAHMHEADRVTDIAWLQLTLRFAIVLEAGQLRKQCWRTFQLALCPDLSLQQPGAVTLPRKH